MEESSYFRSTRKLPNSLKSKQARSTQNRFDFSWIGGIAHRIRNVLHQRTNEETRSIERQSEIAMQERVHSFIADRSMMEDDTLNLEPSQQLRRKMASNQNRDAHAVDLMKPPFYDSHAETDLRDPWPSNSKNPNLHNSYSEAHKPEKISFASGMSNSDSEEKNKEDLGEEIDEFYELDEADELDYELDGANLNGEISDAVSEKHYFAERMESDLDEELADDFVNIQSATPEIDIAEYVDPSDCEASVEFVEPSDHEVQEYNPELSSMSIWEENGFDTYDQKSVLESEYEPDHTPAEETASAPATQSFDSTFKPVDRFVGFEFGPSQASVLADVTTEYAEAENEPPSQPNKIREMEEESVDSSIVNTEVHPEDLQSDRLTLEAGESKEWNLFRVGFNVVPSKSDSNRWEEGSSGHHKATMAASADFDEEFNLLAQAAHRLISDSSIFGGAPKLPKRKRETSSESNGLRIAPVNSEEETHRVTSLAHVLFSDSPLFGGVRKKLKVEQEGITLPSECSAAQAIDQGATQQISSVNTVEATSEGDSVIIPLASGLTTSQTVEDFIISNEKPPAKRSRSSRKFKKAPSGQVPERTGPMTRARLKKLEGDEAQQSQTSVKSSSPKKSIPSAERAPRTRAKRSRKGQ